MSWGVKEDKTQLNKYSTEQKNVKELNQGIPKEIKDIRLQHNVILANTIERPKVSLLSKNINSNVPLTYSLALASDDESKRVQHT